MHNILNMQLVQSINFPTSAPLTVLSDGRGDRVFVASSSSPASIYSLVPTPVAALVDDMLRSGHVEDAIELFRATWPREARASGGTDADFKKKLSQIHETAGMHELRKFQFDIAFGHFDKAGVDARLLISLFPGLLAEQSTFTTPSKESITDISMLKAPTQ